MGRSLGKKLNNDDARDDKGKANQGRQVEPLIIDDKGDHGN